MDLSELGVEVRTGALVTGVDTAGVDVGAERIEARSVFWAAGVEAEKLTTHLGSVPLDRAGRVKIASDLSIPGFPDAFVIGDAAMLVQDGVL